MSVHCLAFAWLQPQFEHPHSIVLKPNSQTTLLTFYRAHGHEDRARDNRNRRDHAAVNRIPHHVSLLRLYARPSPSRLTAGGSAATTAKPTASAAAAG